MDAKTYPLQDILKPERRYIIPTFQRDYEWTREGQWRLLFEDLAATADRLLEARASQDASSLTSREQRVSPHFLGAIVCASLRFPAGGVALRSVIDGQQRLTTSQLLIRGLLDVLAETDSDRTKSVRRMLRNPSDVVEKPEEVHKLWPRRKDREVWPTAMDDAIPAYQGESDHLYLQARKFFADEARDYAVTADQPSDPLRLVALADAVSSLFKLVVIDLDDNDDAQVIFEVLNGRQTPLSAIDLVKNLLFLRGELNDDDVDALYDAHWAQFDDPWWKKEVGRGHAARGRRDVLLSAWLTAATGAEASVAHLYREARAYLEGGPPTEDVLIELSRFAAAYRVVYGADPAEDQRLTTAYERIRSLDITTAVPLLTWLRTISGPGLSLQGHVRAARAVESWSLRRVYVGAQTRGYGSHFARVLREARQAHEKGVDVADTVVASLQDGQLSWPTDVELSGAFATRRFYDNLTQPRIRLLLGAIDGQLRDEDPHEPSASIDYDGLQIEHVMPRSWHKHWPMHALDGRVLAEDDTDPQWLHAAAQRSAVLERIGNLTLVTGTFNRDVSNRAWDVKRPEFEKQRSLLLNYAVARASRWDEDHIQARAEQLATVAARVWPTPEALLSSFATGPGGPPRDGGAGPVVRGASERLRMPAISGSLRDQRPGQLPETSETQPVTYPRESRGGTPASRSDALAYNSRWTEHDRQVVSAELDRIRDRTSYFWRTKTNSYIRATDADGKALLYVEAGFLWWPQGSVERLPDGVIADGDGWLLPLSTRQDSGPRRGPRDEENLPICQTCLSYALSSTGLCPSCDE